MAFKQHIASRLLFCVTAVILSRFLRYGSDSHVIFSVTAATGDNGTCPSDAAGCRPGHKLNPWPGVVQRLKDEDYDKFHTWKDVPWTFDLDSVPCNIQVIDLKNSSMREELLENLVHYRSGSRTLGLPVLIRNADGRLGELPFKQLQDFDWVVEQVQDYYVKPFDLSPAHAGMDKDNTPRMYFSPDLRGFFFHEHEYFFNERLSGRKLWLFYRSTSKVVHKILAKHKAEESSLSWVLEVLPELKEADRPHVCMQRAGDIMFLPGGVWHLTLNIEDGHQMTQ